MPPKMKNKLGGGGVNPLTDGQPHTPAVSPLRDTESSAAAAAATPPAGPATPSTVAPAAAAETRRPNVMSLPIPEEGSGELTATEEEHLKICETSIEELRLAFASAGRALQIIRDGRLYRGLYKSFDDYVEQRWGMQRSYANKLIRAWPLADRLRPHAPALNEGQVRELLPVATEFGDDAAVVVYRAVAEADGVKVTAGTLRDAVAILPTEFDDNTVIERIRAWLRGEWSPQSTKAKTGVFESAGSRVDALTNKVVKKTSQDPDGARAFAAKLRSLAERIEHEIVPAAGE